MECNAKEMKNVWSAEKR